MSATQDNECSRKDKRLLVLLAFGALVLAMNLGRPHQIVRQAPQQMWLELHGDRGGLYRMTEPEQFFLIRQDKQFHDNPFSNEQQLFESIQSSWKNRDRFAALKKNKTGVYESAAASPDVLYFLEQHVPINRADTAALEMVPGIGPYLAGNIVEYRNRVGRINGKHELTAIPGIGKSRSKKLAPFFSFE